MTETICRIPLTNVRIILLVLNLRRVAGWVAGGCWDYEIDSDEFWIIPENSLRFYAAGTSYGMGFPMGWRYGFEFSMAIMNPHDDPVLVEKSWRSFHQFWIVLVFFFSQKSSNIRFFWDFRSGFSIRFFWDRIHFVIASTRPLAVALLFCCSNPEVWQDRQVT